MSSIENITVATKMLSMTKLNQINPRQSCNRDAIIAMKMEIERNRRDIIMNERFERHLMAYKQRKI
jgi:hypothetical protein